MWFRGLWKILFFLIAFWEIDVYALEGGALVPIEGTLVRKSKGVFGFEDGNYDLEWSSKIPGMVLGDRMAFLWQGSGGGMTAIPLAIEPYLEEYKKDREAIRNTPIYDEESEQVVMMPSLDYKLGHRMWKRELYEGWFSGQRAKRLLTVIIILIVCLAVVGVVSGYEGATKVAVRECFDPHGSFNSTNWTPLPCPALNQVVSHTATTTTGHLPGNVGP